MASTAAMNIECYADVAYRADKVENRADVLRCAEVEYYAGKNQHEARVGLAQAAAAAAGRTRQR